MQFSSCMVLEKELDTMQWLKTIVMKNQPLGAVEDTVWWEFSSMKSSVSKGTFRELIFKLIELVDNDIKVELGKTTYGAIMHDG